MGSQMGQEDCCPDVVGGEILVDNSGGARVVPVVALGSELSILHGCMNKDVLG
jgi:hypothetical protein